MANWLISGQALIVAERRFGHRSLLGCEGRGAEIIFLMAGPDSAHCQTFVIGSKLHLRSPHLDIGDPGDRRREHMHAIEVTKTSLPHVSALHERREPGDFLDCYSVPASMSARDAALVITDFPYWARLLLMIRRIITAPFGLDNDGPEAADRVGIFPVESETATELIAGFDDKHLNFQMDG